MVDGLNAVVDLFKADIMAVVDDLVLWCSVYWLLMRLIRHSASLARGRSQSEGDLKRLDTLERVGVSALRVVVLSALVLSFLDVVGVNVKGLLAGVGVAGLGLSLAAQSIIKDFLCGILIFTENQFNVGDVVSIGSFSGVVESFNLRVTHLRNLDGELIIIPNGQINTVVNQTKGWSVAKVEVGISYEADHGRFMELMKECGARLLDEMEELVLEPPEVQGIVDFRDSWMTLRVLIKTRPGRHWEVGRRYRAILKEAIDQRGMAMAYPRLDVLLVGPHGAKTPIP